MLSFDSSGQLSQAVTAAAADAAAQGATGSQISLQVVEPLCCGSCCRASTSPHHGGQASELRC